MVDPGSFLFITLDSCRYDSFASAEAPNLKSVGPLHLAIAPGNFTYSSHAAMFVGFTPGVPTAREPYVNPKYGRIFKIISPGFSGVHSPFVTLSGHNIIDGFKRIGYLTLGTGAARWFDPQAPTGRLLTSDFDDYYYPGNTYSLRKQLEWIGDQLQRHRERKVFLFINVGETHVRYYYEGAPWSLDYNPCVPFSDKNNAEECRRRQNACLEFVDSKLGDLLREFQQANVIICSDHGDVWGEDGLWEHGIHHPKVMEVPLIIRLLNSPNNGPSQWSKSNSNRYFIFSQEA